MDPTATKPLANSRTAWKPQTTSHQDLPEIGRSRKQLHRQFRDLDPEHQAGVDWGRGQPLLSEEPLRAMQAAARHGAKAHSLASAEFPPFIFVTTIVFRAVDPSANDLGEIEVL